MLLVSADFLASDYCYDVEMTRALERHNAGEAYVIPVIVRDVNWSHTPFAGLQALPRDGRAVRRWPNLDGAWRSVAEGIKTAAMELSKTKEDARRDMVGNRTENVKKGKDGQGTKGNTKKR